MKPFIRFVFAFALLAQASPGQAEINGYAAMGASVTAGSPNDYTGSWLPWLVNQRGLNFGGAGNPYNVAVGGATSSTLLAQGQHTEVASLVQAGNVDLAFLSIGNNDFGSVASQVAAGTISAAALDAWAQGLVGNIETALDTVLAAVPTGMIVNGMADSPLTPAGRALFNTPEKRARGQAAVDLVDSYLEPAVLARGQVFVDYAGALRNLNAQPLFVGGVEIDTVTASRDPTHLFKDNVHPAAVGNGILANQFLAALNLGYGTDFALFTDLEILTIAGLAQQYSGETSNLDYAQFVVLPVPEPSTLGLSLVAGLALGLVRCSRRGVQRLAVAGLALAFFAGATAAQAAVIDGYASMGASESAGTTYTGSWIPYLANQRGFNFGVAGQPYNVAVGGARTNTLLTQGQHTQVQTLVQNGEVDVAYLFIGANDFFAVGANIASGALTGPALETWAQGVVNNIGTAMDTVLLAGPQGMIVTGMPDILLTPGGRAVFDTPAEIARGTAAVDLVNSLLKPAVLGRGQAYIDLALANREANLVPLVVGGVPIDTVNASSDPTHFFQDGRHPAAVGNGIIANLFLTATNMAFGTNHVPFTDLEILTTAGLAGQYMGETSALPYERYVVLPVPEPATIWLAVSAAASLVFVGRRRLRRN